MKLRFLLLIISFNVFSCCLAQMENKANRAVFYGGFGTGLDYGGIGFKAEYLPSKHVSVFAGAGANFDKVGLNGGLSFKIIPDKKSTPFITAMYGYNGVLKTKSVVGNVTTFVKTYYGFSAGGGYDIRVGKKMNKISLAVLFPFRSQKFTNKYNELKNAGYTFKPDKSNVMGSIGFNIGVSGK